MHIAHKQAACRLAGGWPPKRMHVTAMSAGPINKDECHEQCTVLPPRRYRFEWIILVQCSLIHDCFLVFLELDVCSEYA